MIEVIDYSTGEKSYGFSKNDLVMLSKRIGLDPCDRCRNWVRVSCCGCSEHSQWRLVAEKYKEQGLLEFAIQMEKTRQVGEILGKNSIAYMEEKMKLPEVLQELL